MSCDPLADFQEHPEEVEPLEEPEEEEEEAEESPCYGYAEGTPEESQYFTLPDGGLESYPPFDADPSQYMEHYQQGDPMHFYPAPMQHYDPRQQTGPLTLDSSEFGAPSYNMYSPSSLPSSPNGSNIQDAESMGQQGYGEVNPPMYNYPQAIPSPIPPIPPPPHMPSLVHPAFYEFQAQFNSVQHEIDHLQKQLLNHVAQMVEESLDEKCHHARQPKVPNQTTSETRNAWEGLNLRQWSGDPGACDHRPRNTRFH